MATSSSSPSSTTTCRNENDCFFNPDTREQLLEINCMLKNLIHRCECSSARNRSDAGSLCHQEELGNGTAEVTQEEISHVLNEIEASVQTLRQDHNKHADLHKTRAHKGRTVRDSGYISWRNSGPISPIPEEGPDRSGTRQPAEHKEEASKEDTTNL